MERFTMHRTMVRSAGLVGLAGLLAVGACGNDDADPAETGVAPEETSTSVAPEVEETAATIPAPAGLPEFYATPDPVPDVDHGTLLASEAVSVEGLDGSAYRVMYASESVAGDPIAVTGIVAIPGGEAPEGGFPVIAWAHGTTGIADVCAPSLNAGDTVSVANELLAQGYAVAATDYEGLGTPGRHPYIVGESEGRGVVDSVRAAHQLGTELSDRYLVWGHSQGGHAAMFALDIAADWAPELELVGVVAGAPPSQFELLNSALQQSPYKYYLLMVAAGFNAAYGDEGAPLDAVLTPEGLEMLELVDDGCSAVEEAMADVEPDELIAADPATEPEWLDALHRNDPGLFQDPADVPLLVIHGGSDEQIPVAASALMFDQLCAIGQDQTRWVYPGQSHAGVIAPSLADMTTWIDNRFAEVASPDAMEPTGQADVEVQRCPVAEG